jgi:hypothetical protein
VEDKAQYDIHIKGFTNSISYRRGLY